MWSDVDHYTQVLHKVDTRDAQGHTGDMKTNKGSKMSAGFGIQKEISLTDGAVVYLRITNPRRLNLDLLGQVLTKFFKGGYTNLVLDQGKGQTKALDFSTFLTLVRSLSDESKCLFLERKLIRETGYGRRR